MISGAISALNFVQMPRPMSRKALGLSGRYMYIQARLDPTKPPDTRIRGLAYARTVRCSSLMASLARITHKMSIPLQCRYLFVGEAPPSALLCHQPRARDVRQGDRPLHHQQPEGQGATHSAALR